VRFICGLAHAKWKEDPLDLVPTFKVFPDRWTCSIVYGTPLDEWDLSTELRDSASDANTEHLLEMYECGGYWKFAKNLIGQRMNPILWRSWRQPMNVEDLVQYQDYQIKKGSSYPITLIWYPLRQRLSTPSDAVDLATVTVTQTATQHKRTISEAITAAEGLVRKETRKTNSALCSVTTYNTVSKMCREFAGSFAHVPLYLAPKIVPRIITLVPSVHSLN
jgi:hypothetical protein